ncbi:hypothetical protein DPMN_114184 [Dreissena polymorpha]|uniref:Uncharacterized protein n=1 Tax=Dreissena polymorpha TaxID=45954 RepID=A0A9D4KIZ5_DREPO|nr:hypothetical protein DPMN_114184 [Dreissena polymorpha]
MNVDTKAAISSNLWEALNGFNIKRVTLSLDSVWCGLINNVSILSQALISNNMETICIYLNAQPCMMEAMHGLPIKRLSLYDSGERLDINNVSSLYKLLSSLKQLEKLSVIVNNDSPGLWEALHGLKIKSLSLNDGIGCLRLSHVTSLYYNVPSLSQLLSSFSQLETLHIKVCSYRRSGLWDAFRGLNIKSLSGLSGGLDGLVKDSAVKQMETLSLVFPSLTLLETLSIGVDDDCGLSEALRGLYIKRLCLSGGLSEGLHVHHAELLSQSLVSLTVPEYLSQNYATY